MSLSETLAESQSGRCLQAIAQRYRLTSDQAQRATELFRPILLQQIEADLATKNGALNLLRTIAQPALAEIEAHPDNILDHPVRLAGDAIYRQFSRHDPDTWTTLDGIACDVGVSHQVFRALVPCLTLVIVSALRRTAAPAFLRLLLRHRPDDRSTDPFAFACEHADALQGRTIQPETALRWLDLVLARTDADKHHLRADPADRFR